jgi:2-amino-4-hydroxy-6-hydroxymethyldihydropteridine diphosphokinase
VDGVFVGVGANLGDREATIRRALALLDGRPGIEVVAVSSLRETDPVGLVDQPPFLNGAAELRTELSPRELLDELLAVERELGRAGGRGRAGAHRSASAAARAPLRPGAARRARRGPGDPRSWPGGHAALAARLSAMSHLDELDEFEAKLELELKREYTAVFGLFRYCILTQDATYLCNKLDLKVVPQASYPFFHITMEDVWVWDKNRPTRIIPRAEVYTSSDVTVEELRGEGDEPKLTAEALAERIGETLSSDDDAV